MKPTMINAVPTFGFLIGDWHLVFAWLPIRTYDYRLVWLRKVWRTRCVLKEHLSHLNGSDQWWIYSLDEAENDQPENT